MPAPTPRRGGREVPANLDAEFVEDVLARNVRAYRLLRNLEQLDVAYRISVVAGHRWTPATVSEIERGRRNVTVPELLALTVVLGTTVELLLDPRGPERRKGPALYVGGPAPHTGDTLAIEPDNVTGLICSHRSDLTVVWQGDDLAVVEFTEVER
jgi:transcriptional regulator with XRE-family HTH domain